MHIFYLLLNPHPYTTIQKQPSRFAKLFKNKTKRCPRESSCSIYSCVFNLRRNRLCLTTPDIVGNLPDKLQLLAHVLVTERVALGVTGESTLWRDTNTLEGVLSALVVALSDEVGSLVDAINHGLLVLELGELRGDDAEDDVLVLGEVLKGLEAASAGGVVLEVVGVDVEVLKQLLCNVVVRALGEVTAAHIVSAAQVDAQVHVCWALEAGVIELDVGVEHLVGRLGVVLVGGPALEHGFRAEVCRVSVNNDFMDWRR